MKAILRTTLDRDLVNEAKKIAREREISISAMLERALDRYLLLLTGGKENHKDQRRAS